MSEQVQQKVIKAITNYLVFIGIAFLVTIGWQVLEIHFLGEVKPNKIDTIIALILTSSLYCNWKHYRK